MTAVFKIDNTSEIFLLIGYTITARETRHRSGSVSYEYTDIPKNKGNPTETEPIQFYACRTFRRRKKRESGSVVSKVCPKGTRRNFWKTYFFKYSKLLRAFDTARKLSQTPNAERFSRKVAEPLYFVGELYGYIWILSGESSGRVSCKGVFRVI